MEGHTAETEIARIVNRWGFFRDQGRWDELLATFHEDGTISISWIDGPFSVFVAASRMAAQNGAIVLKHRIGVPSIEVHGDHATSEVNVAILLRATTEFGRVDVTSYARFFDLFEARSGAWKIFRRTGIYEKDRADPVDAGALPDAFFEGLDAAPSELRFLAGTLGRFGVMLSPTTVVDRSESAAAVYREGARWLAGG